MSLAKEYQYRIVDVFTQQALEGNALAVFLSGRGLDDATMQKIAREMNLSETVFVLPPTRSDCAVSVRIFTPAKEVMFAGHPTVGVSYVLLDEGVVQHSSERFVLEEQVGPVPIRVERGDSPLIWLKTPPIQDGLTFDSILCARVLGLKREDLLEVKPQLLSAGNPTLLVALKDKAAVDRCFLDMGGMKELKEHYPESFCVFVFTPTVDGAYSRMFGPEYGIIEDPATGSSTGPLAAYMMRHKLISGRAGNRFISEQGTKMGRRSILHVEIHGDGGAEGIEIGGYVTPIARGVLRLSSSEPGKSPTQEQSVIR